MTVNQPIIIYQILQIQKPTSLQSSSHHHDKQLSTYSQLICHQQLNKPQAIIITIIKPQHSYFIMQNISFLNKILQKEQTRNRNHIGGQLVKKSGNYAEIRKIEKMENSFQIFSRSQYNLIKNITSYFENLMPQDNIFLDEETYLKRNPSTQELQQLKMKEDSRQIARFFTSKQSSTNEMRQAVSDQIEKVLQNLPFKLKSIFKNKFHRLPKQKKCRNGKFQQSVKFSKAYSKTEADHQILDFFDTRIQTLPKYN